MCFVFFFVNFANGISCYTSLPSPFEKKKKKSPDNRSSSPQCVNLSYLYKDLQGYKHTSCTHTGVQTHTFLTRKHTRTHTRAWVSIHRILFRKRRKNESLCRKGKMEGRGHSSCHCKGKMAEEEQGSVYINCPR